MSEEKTGQLLPFPVDSSRSSIESAIFALLRKKKIVPRRSDIVSMLLNVEATQGEVEFVLRSMLGQGKLKELWIGNEEHVALSADSEEQAPKDEAAFETSTSEDSEFTMQIAIDAEKERLLLYRVLVMLFVVGALLLARELVLLFV